MSQINRLLRREKVNLCFITSDPSSNNGKTSNLHMVRSHAGKWRWSETRKKKGHMSRDKASLRTNYAGGHISEEYDTSDTSISDTSFGTSLSGSKDSSPDVDLGVLFEALEEKVNGIEVPGVFPPEETESFDSTDFCGSEMSGYPTAGCVNLYGIAPNILDPFQQYPHTSPLPSDLVSDANRYSLSVLWPGLLPPSFRASHPGVNAWLENSATHEALHSTLLFGSYSHRRTLWLVKNRGHFSNEDGKKLSLCEADAIVRVNRAIQSPSGAVTDCIILCVLCMATNKVDGPMWDQNQERIFQAPLTSLQWLDIYGRLSPHPVHQAGLVQLVRLRGGLEKIELPGLAAIISYSSILGASRSLSRPSFPFVSLRTGSYLGLQDIIGTHVKHFESIQIPSHMQDILQSQRIYVSEIEMYEDGVQIGTDLLCDHRNIIQWHIMSLLPSIQLDSAHATTYPLYESCRLALIIFGVGVTFPLPPQSTPLKTLGRMLKLELQSHQHEAQNTSPSNLNLYMWILSLGCIAVADSPERDWFIDELRFHITCHGPSTWHDFRADLKSILWLDSACGMAGKIIWNDVMSS